MLAATVVSSALCSTAQGQTNAAFFGSIDEGITYTNNTQGKRTALVGPAAVPDFFGLRGSERLTDSLSAFFALQQGFRSNNGQPILPGEAYSYFSYVGLSIKRVGSFAFGRQLDLAADALRVNSNGSNHLSFYYFHPANLDNLGILGDSIENAIKYSTPLFHAVQASALYGIADRTNQHGRVLSLAIVLDRHPLRVSVVYSSWRDHAIPLVSGLGRSEFLGQYLGGGATFLAKRQDIYGLSAFYAVGKLIDVHAVLSQVNLASSSQSDRMRNVEFGVNYHLTTVDTITFGGYESWLSGTRYSEVGLGNLFAASKRTTLYVQAVCQHTHGTANAAIPLLAASSSRNQLALRIGVHHFF